MKYVTLNCASCNITWTVIFLNFRFKKQKFFEYRDYWFISTVQLYIVNNQTDFQIIAISDSTRFVSMVQGEKKRLQGKIASSQSVLLLNQQMQ